MTKRPKPRPQFPWDAIDLALHEVSALKAMIAAHPVAIEILCVKICRERQLSFTIGLGPDSARATDFAEGKRAVAEILRGIPLVKMPAPSQQETGPHAVPKGEPPKD